MGVIFLPPPMQAAGWTRCLREDGIETCLLIVPAIGACREDLDASGDVGITDFLALLAHWGPCP